MTQLIGITGKARSGKDSLAEIVARNHSVYVTSFAEPMRLLLCDILSVDLDQLDAIKSEPHPILGGKTPRVALQHLGTEYGRQMIDANLWVNVVSHKIDQAMASHHYDFVMITDVRFDNEAELIKEKNGQILQVIRPDMTIKESAHSSEQGIASDLIDQTLMNDGSWEDYIELVERTLEIDRLTPQLSSGM